jgi:hypothetical protein
VTVSRRAAIASIALCLVALLGLLLLDRPVGPPPPEEGTKSQPAPGTEAPAHPPSPRTRHRDPSEMPTPKAERAVRPPATPHAAFIVDVKGPDGSPVERAKVTLLDAGSERRLALSTDGSGTASFDLPDSLRARRIVVEREGYGTANEWIADLPRSPASGRDEVRVSVTLRTAATIEGTLRFVTGAPDTKRASVVAYPLRAEKATRAELLDAIEGRTPGVHVAASDDGGRFSIRDVESGSPYQVLVRKPGWIQIAGNDPGPPIAFAGTGPVTVDLAPLYVMAVRVRQRGGAPIAMSRARSIPESRWQEPAYSVGAFLPGHEAFWMALPASAEDVRTTCWLFMGFAGLVDRPTLGPVPATIAEPGYEAAKAELVAHRVAASAITVQDVELDPVAPALGFGRLVVKWPAAAGSGPDVRADGAPPDETETAFGELRLYSVESPPTSTSGILIPLNGRLETESFERIPAGRYQMMLRVALVRPPPGTTVVEIRPDATTEVTVPLPPTAALEVQADVVDELGSRPYRGMVVVRLFHPATQVNGF